MGVYLQALWKVHVPLKESNVHLKKLDRHAHTHQSAPQRACLLCWRTVIPDHNVFALCFVQQLLTDSKRFKSGNIWPYFRASLPPAASASHKGS